MQRVQSKPHAMNPGACSDCGNISLRRVHLVDHHTSSTVALCPNCLPAFLHRQQWTAGCCG